MSGSPFTVLTGTDNSRTGSGKDRADSNGQNASLSSDRSTDEKLQKQLLLATHQQQVLELNQNQLALTNIELEENHQDLYQLKINVENELIKTNQNLALLERELSKQYLIATTNGTVNFICRKCTGQIIYFFFV
jgi:hypothetical protein